MSGNIHNETELIFGEPVDPMSTEHSDALARIVAKEESIVEAYLPLCYIEGAETASQVLVIGVRSAEDIPLMMGSVMPEVLAIATDENYTDIMPFPAEAIPDVARVMAIKTPQ